ncbi:MAG: hypothetical protein ABIJ57_16620 [Pseudomonadota bacterium]
MKIVAGNKSSLIVRVENGKEYDGIVNRISSTELQPYYGINFLDGKVVGGRTMSQSSVDAMVAAARKANLQIEE